MVDVEKSPNTKTLVLRENAPDIKSLLSGLQVRPLPPPKKRDSSIAHAPKRNHRLSDEGKKVIILLEFELKWMTSFVITFCLQ